MADTGWVLVQAGSETAGSGVDQWTNESNVVSDNGAYATSSITDGSTTYWLMGTNLVGDPVPTGATIDGVEIRINAKAETSLDVQFHGLALVISGSINATSERTYTTSLTTSDVNYTSGSASDLWSLTTLTDTVVNSSGFGFALQMENVGGDPWTGYVDAMWMRITYTESAGGGGGNLIWPIT